MDSLLLGGWLAKWTYRLGLQGRLGVTTHAIRLATAESLSAPLVLAFASDFHAGPTTHPDVYAHLSSFSPPLGKYAVLGNHDLWSDTEQIVRRLTAAGVDVLVNRNAPLAVACRAVTRADFSQCPGTDR